MPNYNLFKLKSVIFQFLQKPSKTYIDQNTIKMHKTMETELSH